MKPTKLLSFHFCFIVLNVLTGTEHASQHNQSQLAALHSTPFSAVAPLVASKSAVQEPVQQPVYIAQTNPVPWRILHVPCIEGCKLRFLNAGKALESGGASGVFHYWDTGTGRLLRTIKEGRRSAHYDLCSSNRRVGLSVEDASGEKPGVTLWDYAGGRKIRTLKVSSLPPLQLSPNGSILVSVLPASNRQQGEQTDRVALWNVRTGRRLHVLKWIRPGGPRQWPHEPDVIFSPDGKLLATIEEWLIGSEPGYFSHRISIWDVQTGRLRRTLPVVQGGNLTGAFVANNRLFVAKTNQPRFMGTYSVRLWDLARGRKLQEYERSEIPGIIASVTAAFSADGKRIATAGMDHFNDYPGETIYVSDILENRVVGTFNIDGGINDIALSPNGRLLAASNLSNKVVLWKIKQSRAISHRR